MRLHPNQLLYASALQGFAGAVDAFEHHRGTGREREGLKPGSERHEQHAALNDEVAPLRDEDWRRALVIGLAAVVMFGQAFPPALRVLSRQGVLALYEVPPEKPTIFTTSRRSVARSCNVVASTPECMGRA